MADKFELYHSAQSWFAKNPELYASDRSKALEIICRKVIEVMNVQRVGLWFYTLDKSQMYEELTCTIEGKISRGALLPKKSYPVYFSKLETERVLVSEDAFHDPDLSEFIDSYLSPLGVHSLVDAPIYSDGEMIGIICCEQVGSKRKWESLDASFVATVSDLVGRVIESEKRHSYERELKHRIHYLEKDLKHKLQDLKDTSISLNLALEGAQVGKWDWNIVNNQLNLSRIWYSKLGYEYRELPEVLSTFVDRIHPEDRDRVMKEVELHVRGETFFYESRFRMLTKNGEVQWCLDRGYIIERDTSGNPLRMIGVNINVTPIMKLEQGLIQSEQQLKSMIESLPTAIAMFDKNFNYVAYSKKWQEEWSQYSEVRTGQGVNKKLGVFYSMWIERMKEAMTGKTLYHDEDLIELIQGQHLWVRWILKPWKNEAGEICGVVVMAENITDRKEAEMRIAQSSKLSALGEMAGGIAHEINNPLSIIKGYIDLLKRHSSRHTLSKELMLQYVNKMDLTVSRISRIVNGMRRFSRESSLDEKTSYSLNKVIEETLDICQERIHNNGTALDVEFFKDDSLIYCRPVELSQVLLNLINNAYQAISNYPHPWIKIKCESVDNVHRILVIDSGQGIPGFIRQKLFQPFFTTKDIGVGTGLGLSISRGIVEEHAGRLFYQEDAPHTTFVVELPKIHKETSPFIQSQHNH